MRRVARAASVVSCLVAAAVVAWLAAGGSAPWFRLDAAAAQGPDTDGDTMPDAWETFFGLDPNDAADASGDPDAHGLTNAQEYAARRHPLGRHARCFAEGSTGFFDTSVTQRDVGIVCYERKDMNRAARAFDRYLQLPPDAPEAPKIRTFLNQLRQPPQS